MIPRKKREIDVLVLSDIHLGTFGCKAKELLKYLKSVKPKRIILNGDIIDMWQFSRHYFPASHMKVVKYLTGCLAKGIPVDYVTGNHDEMLRKFKGFELGGFSIVNKLILDLDGKKTWIFHGDVFDVTMKHSKWLAQLGGKGYDLLILINTMVNWMSEKMGYGRISFSKKIKKSVKGAIDHIMSFENTVCDIALENEFDYVICGHIHEPKIRWYSNEDASNRLLYLNSGDWVESMTALEYTDGYWSIYEYANDIDLAKDTDLEVDIENENLTVSGAPLQELLTEFHILSAK